MCTEYRDLTALTFEGEDFVDHGLDLDFLPELAAYKQLVVKTAEALWRAKHPDRKNLPKGFTDGIRLKVFDIRPNCATLPIKREVVMDDTGAQMDMFDNEPNILDEAVTLIEDAVEAVAKDGVLPESFPKNVIRLFDDFGKRLRPGNTIRMKSPQRVHGVPYTPEIRNRLVNWMDSFYEDEVSVTGQVQQADVDGCKFTLRLENGMKIPGKFDPEDETIVTNALRDHRSQMLRVKGRGRFVTANGRLERLVRVDSLDIVEHGDVCYDDSVPPLWQQIVAIGASVPEEEWGKLPTDLARNLDDYLYAKE